MEKNKKKRTTSGTVIFVFIIILLMLKVFYPTSSKMSTASNWRKDALDELVKRQSYLINDSLPQYAYKRKQDSIRNILFHENYRNSSCSGINAFLIGVQECNYNNYNKYHLKAFGYFFTEHFEVYTLKGKNYIEYSIWGPENNGTRIGIPKIVETNLKLEQVDTREWEVSFPISKNQYYFWKAVVVILMIISFILVVYGIVGLPLRFLYLISKGKAFTEEAIGLLYTIAAIFIGAGLFYGLGNLVVHLYYRSDVPYPLTFYIYDDLMSGWSSITSGLVVLLFAKAFIHGCQIQEEQNLTV